MQEVRELLPVQIAGFMVNPTIVKKDNEKTKTKRCSDGHRRRVYFSCNHIGPRGREPHVNGFQFVNMEEAPLRG